MVNCKTLIFDPAKCIGCRICELICSLTKFGEFSPKKSYIRLLRNEEMSVEVVSLMVKCDLCGGERKCVKFCPTGALEFVDHDKAALMRKRIRIGKFPAPHI